MRRAVKPEPDVFTARLRSVGNPDFGQYAAISNPEEVICETLEQVRQACLDYISKWNLGSGNWPRTVIKHNGKPLCSVSYNGRLWKIGATEYKDQDEYKP